MKKNLTAEQRKARIDALIPFIDEFNELRTREIEDAEGTRISALTGKCFMYENTYGAGDPEPKWFAYYRILGKGKAYGVRGVYFEDDRRGLMRIHVDDFMVDTFARSGYVEISLRHYSTELRSFLRKVDASTKAPVSKKGLPKDAQRTRPTPSRSRSRLV